MEKERSEDGSGSFVKKIYQCKRKNPDPMITLRAPRGVTRMGGANVYAAKFATE